MPRPGWLQRLLSVWLTLWLAVFSPHPAAAFLGGGLSIEQERQIGEEFAMQLQQYYLIINDPFLVSYINRLGQRLVSQIGPQPFTYRFHILEDPTMNAFAVPGGYIYVTTGFIRMMEREGELAGVLAHEIAHIHGRHLTRQLERSRVVNVASVLGALAGLLVGVGPLTQALMVGSMAAGEASMLKYSREHEAEADALGIRWMAKAGYDPRDMMSVYRKMRRQRWFEGSDLPVYLSTHPDINSRIVDLAHHLSAYEQPRVGRNDPDFPFFVLKLESLVGRPAQLLRRTSQDLERRPQDPAVHYGRALALAKLQRPEEALAAFRQALKLAPGHPLITRDLAIFHFERTRFAEAQPLFEELLRRDPGDATSLYYLARIARERRQTAQALTLLEKAHRLNPSFVEVYLDLGTLYGEKGDLGLAHYYLGLHSLMTKAYPTALFHFRKAAEHLSASDRRLAEARRQVARLQKMKVKVAN
jgi:predicted Zn-dependent protease